MAAAIGLRDDFDGPALRRLAKGTKDAAHARRLLALAEIYDGGSRTMRRGSAASVFRRPRLGAALQRARSGRADRRQGAGQCRQADDAQRRALAEIVESGPIPAIHGVVRWRLQGSGAVDLRGVPHLAERDHGRPRTAGAGLSQALGASAPSCAERVRATRLSKKLPGRAGGDPAKLPAGTEIELWWQDEARIGQKNKITRRWARRGTRPVAPHDQRTMWAYIFGADLPEEGQGRRPRPALLRHRGDEPAPGRDQRRRRSRRPCRADPRPGRLAHVAEARRARPTSRCCRCRRDRPS